MAINKLVFPTAGTPTVPTDYTYQNNYIAKNAIGTGVNLSNWDDSSTKPQVLSGSSIEANGAIWNITTDTDISTTGASAGTVYLVFDDSVPEFKFTNTSPSWNNTLCGWYVSGTRFTGHEIEWDGATAFSDKHLYNGNNNQSSIIKFGANGGIYLTANKQAFNTQVVVSPDNFIYPAGLIYATAISNGTAGNITGSVQMESTTAPGWVTLYGTGVLAAGGTASAGGVLLFSNGSNYRFLATGASGNVTIGYMRLT